MRGLILAPLLAAYAAAAPQPQPKPSGVQGAAVYAKLETHTVVSTVYSTASAAPTAVRMIPFPNPKIDQKDLENLKATKDASMRYAESHDDIDQEVATITSDDTENPLVQLEHSSFIEKLSCTDKSAIVVFKDPKAYQTAADDWKTHDQFIIVSYDPNCGPNHDASKRDYMLAKSVTVDKKTLTITAEVTFVEFEEAFGQEATIRCEVGLYHSTQPTKRGLWDDIKDDLTPGGKYTKSMSGDWNNYPTNEMTNSYGWGSGWQLYGDDTHNVACVGCGTDGSVTVTGEFEWKGLSIKTAKVTLEGHMKGTLAVGIEGSASASIPIKNIELAQIPLSPLSIAGIVTIGPMITVSVGASLELEGNGAMVVGATLDWPSFKASADYMNQDAIESSGLAPNLENKSSFNGTMKATVDLHLPVSVGVGVDVKGIFNKQVAVVDKPGFELKGQVSNDEGQCQGYGVGADLYNNVGLNLFDIKSVSLTEFRTNMFTTCIETSTSSTVTSSTESATESTAESTPASSTIPMSTSVVGTAGTGVSSGFASVTIASSSAPFGNGTSTTSKPSYPTGTGASTLSSVIGTASGAHFRRY